MTKFSEWSSISKWVVSVASSISALAVIAGGVVWAGDTHYLTKEEHEVYIEQVASQDRQKEIRQLKREIKRLELEEQHGDSSPSDEVYKEFLIEDLEYLQSIE